MVRLAPATLARILPTLVAWLELGAGLVYLWSREWRLAILWIGYGIAALALAGVK